MRSSYLGQPPKSWVLPVTLGCDRSFTVRRKDVAGQAVNWDSLVYIVIDINKASPTTVQAVVDDDLASFVINSNLCDQVKNTTRWRIVMSDTSGIETPLAVGTFERHDG